MGDCELLGAKFVAVTAVAAFLLAGIYLALGWAVKRSRIAWLEWTWVLMGAFLMILNWLYSRRKK